MIFLEYQLNIYNTVSYDVSAFLIDNLMKISYSKKILITANSNFIKSFLHWIINYLTCVFFFNSFENLMQFSKMLLPWRLQSILFFCTSFRNFCRDRVVNLSVTHARITCTLPHWKPIKYMVSFYPSLVTCWLFSKKESCR